MDVYLALNVRPMGKTILFRTDPATGLCIERDISNYLPYQCVAPPLDDPTTVAASLPRAPLDSTLWRPILVKLSFAGLADVRLVMVIRMFRDNLYGGTSGVDHFAYPQVEFYNALDLTPSLDSNGNPNVFVLTDYNTTIPLDAGGFARKYSGWFRHPCIVKAWHGDGNLPVYNVFLTGQQNFADGSSQPYRIQWRFSWEGYPNAPDPVNQQFAIPNDSSGNYPYYPEELGSMLVVDQNSFWQSSQNVNGFPFAILSQSLI
jgi:hypothetical protein